MSASKRQRGTKETVGNALALLLLAVISLYFLRITEGVWWFAAPQAERWWLAAVVLVLYASFCGWSLRPKRARTTPKPRLQSSSKPQHHRPVGAVAAAGVPRHS